jgi:hypothetical protein
MKKNQGLHTISLIRLLLVVLMIFTLVAVLFPTYLLAQNNQSNTIPAKAAQEESFIPSPSSLVPVKPSLEPSPFRSPSLYFGNTSVPLTRHCGKIPT